MLRLLSLGLILVLAADCGGRTLSGGDGAVTPGEDGTTSADSQVLKKDSSAGDQGPADASPVLDLAPPDLAAADMSPADLPPADLPADLFVAPDSGDCTCQPGEVWQMSNCVATKNLGCGPTCDPNDPTSCGLSGMNQVCDPFAAAPCCYCSAAVPACVKGPAMEFEPGELRLYPTSGTAGQSVTLTVDGGTFYIGALIWQMKLGNTVGTNTTHSGSCTLKASFIPSIPGIYPVEVTYMGHGDSLAGFFTASGGVISPPMVQPGYPCTAASTCAQASPYSCSCVQGRCSCTK